MSFGTLATCYISTQADPQNLSLILLLVTTHKRCVGISLRLVPPAEPLASPVCQSKQR